MYVETQTATTNANGLMTLSIGEGTAVSGTFSGIDWASGPYFLKSEIDPNGGTSYTMESVQQLMSVPYALYAKEAAGMDDLLEQLQQLQRPSVSTVSVNNVSYHEAYDTGRLFNSGTYWISGCGFCWSTSQNPTVNGNHTTDGSGTGTFTSSITGLTANTTYYVRAYATNSQGTAYGAQKSFTTANSGNPNDGQPCPGTPTVTDHEGNVYNTVQIGNQCWTKENLRTTTSPSTGTYLIPSSGTGYTYSGKQARWYNEVLGKR